MTTNYQRTANWLKAAGKEPGNAQHLSVQIFCALEEISELISTVRVNQDGWEKVRERIVTDLEDFANAGKQGKIIGHIPQHLRVDSLDAICDTNVTIDGIAYLAKMDKDAADQEALRSNDSKLDENGNAVILPGGKIGKAATYSAPDLKGFV